MLVCPCKTLGIADCEETLSSAEISKHLEEAHGVRSYERDWHGYSCRFKIKLARFSLVGAYKMCILNLKRQRASPEPTGPIREGDRVRTLPDSRGVSHEGTVLSATNARHARIACDDNRNRYFGISQLRHVDVASADESTRILVVVNESDGVVAFNLSNHEREVTCDVGFDSSLQANGNAVLSGIQGHSPERPFEFIPCTKKLALTIRTNRPNTAAVRREVAGVRSNAVSALGGLLNRSDSGSARRRNARRNMGSSSANFGWTDNSDSMAQEDRDASTGRRANRRVRDAAAEIEDRSNLLRGALRGWASRARDRVRNRTPIFSREVSPRMTSNTPSPQEVDSPLAPEPPAPVPVPGSPRAIARTFQPSVQRNQTSSSSGAIHPRRRSRRRVVLPRNSNPRVQVIRTAPDDRIVARRLDALRRPDEGQEDDHLDIVEGVRRRVERVREISLSLENPHIRLSADERESLRRELEAHRAANERDALVLQEQEPNAPERSMRTRHLVNSMAGENEQDAIRAALEVLRRHGSRENSRRSGGSSGRNNSRRSGSDRGRRRAVSIASSNNTGIDLDRDEFFGREE